MEPFILKQIGILHGDIEDTGEAPKCHRESERHGEIEIFPEYGEGLQGIEAGQTIVVVFWLDRADRDVLRVYPRGDRSRGLRGVFSTRSPGRPNPLAISELRVRAVRGTRLEVSGLDILDKTPVVDIKKALGE